MRLSRDARIHGAALRTAVVADSGIATPCNIRSIAMTGTRNRAPILMVGISPRFAAS
jgi:hypothetical protein